MRFYYCVDSLVESGLRTMPSIINHQPVTTSDHQRLTIIHEPITFHCHDNGGPHLFTWMRDSKGDDHMSLFLVS